MTRYLMFEIENLEPLRISDDSTSQRGQTDTLTYIPGSVIRGIVLHGLKEEESFETYKRILLSDQVRFLNAYPVIYGEKGVRQQLLPSVKGFQENKANHPEEEKQADRDGEGKKRIISRVFHTSGPVEGMKGAQLGRYCYPDEDTLYYLSPFTGSDLNLDTKKKEENLFRSQYLQKNQTFLGFIALEEERLQEPLQAALGGKSARKVRIGNHRTAGYGTCRICIKDVQTEFPYQIYGVSEDQKESCYFLLLSDMAMRRADGEITGLDLEYLESLMQVQELKIESSAVSVKEVCGFNRTWNCRVPSVKMYEKGSIFKLSYQGTLKKEVMDRLQEQGIGIRRNEGCGQVLFLGDWKRIGCKRPLDIEKRSRAVSAMGSRQIQSDCSFSTYEKLGAQDRETLTVVAKGYCGGLLDRQMIRYAADTPLPRGGLSNSQLGMIHAILLRYLNEPLKASQELNAYFVKNQKKEDQNKRHRDTGKTRNMESYIKTLLKGETKLDEFMGMKLPDKLMGRKTEEIFSQEEMMGKKIQLLLDMIRYENKEGKENG